MLGGAQAARGQILKTHCGIEAALEEETVGRWGWRQSRRKPQGIGKVEKAQKFL